MPLNAGERLGPYEILALIGKGGMGEVYRAHDPRTGRDVAVKISAERFSERFDREVRAVASLNHPNICHLYDVGPNYLVMEFVDGDGLDERIKAGPIPLEDAVKIAQQVAEALQEAHDRGIVHRDLKPGNIRLTADGTVKVLDFGLAKISSRQESTAPPAENSPTLSMAATQAGVILGTAAYMAPEQAKGKSVDRRADIWAYGVVLYEMITGKRLFDGDDLTEILAAVVMKDPDLSKIPSGVRPVLEVCLQRDPKKRLQAIGDLRLVRQDTKRIGSGVGWRKWMWPSAAAVAMLAAGGLALVHFREVPASQHLLRYTVAPPEGAAVHSFAISPDGKLVVMSASVNGKRQLFLRQTDALQWTPMQSTDDARYPFWSPDSRNIGFFAEGKLRRAAAAGGPSQPVCDVQDGRGGTWNRDDVILFSMNGTLEGQVLRVPASGGAPSAVLKEPRRYLFPMFLPDGQHFLILRRNQGGQEDGVYVASLDGKENRRILQDVSTGVYAPGTGERDGYLVFLRESNLMAQAFDPGRRQLSGDAFPVAENMSLANGNNYDPVTASENGMLLYWTGGAGGVGGSTNQLVWFDRSGKAETVGRVSTALSPAISPDLKTIAASLVQGGTGNRDIWLRDLERGAERRLTTDSSSNTDPFWSPKGDRIVFRSNRGGKSGLYVRASSNAGQDEQLVGGDNIVSNQWSRDGRSIVYASQDPKTKWDLWVLPMEEDGSLPKEKKPVPFLRTPFNELQGQLSPDSKWMAYTSDVSGMREVYVQPFPNPDNEVRVSTAGGEQARWKGDGKELYYLAADGQMTAVPVTVTAGAKPVIKPGTPVPLFDAHSVSVNGNFFNYDVRPDGKGFLVSTTGAVSSVQSGASTPPLTVRVNWQPAKR